MAGIIHYRGEGTDAFLPLPVSSGTGVQKPPRQRVPTTYPEFDAGTRRPTVRGSRLRLPDRTRGQGVNS